jgi:hypothetical protein
MVDGQETDEFGEDRDIDQVDDVVRARMQARSTRRPGSGGFPSSADEMNIISSAGGGVGARDRRRV